MKIEWTTVQFTHALSRCISELDPGLFPESRDKCFEISLSADIRRTQHRRNMVSPMFGYDHNGSHEDRGWILTKIQPLLSLESRENASKSSSLISNGVHIRLQCDIYAFKLQLSCYSEIVAGVVAVVSWWMCARFPLFLHAFGPLR